jgi:hypothetical protein
MNRLDLTIATTRYCYPRIGQPKRTREKLELTFLRVKKTRFKVRIAKKLCNSWTQDGRARLSTLPINSRPSLQSTMINLMDLVSIASIPDLRVAGQAGTYFRRHLSLINFATISQIILLVLKVYEIVDKVKVHKVSNLNYIICA